MKFYGTGIVWDKEKSKVLCKFKNGSFETSDKRVSSVLIDAGYKYEGEIASPSLNLEEMSLKELKSLARDKGITGFSRMKQEELIEKLG